MANEIMSVVNSVGNSVDKTITSEGGRWSLMAVLQNESTHISMQPLTRWPPNGMDWAQTVVSPLLVD